MPSTSLFKKRTPLLAGLAAASFLAVAPQAAAAPFEADLAQTIDDYLTDQGSPMAGSGSTFVALGLRYNVDPRLVVAIAGEESALATSWGTCPEEGNNAWNFVYTGTCADSGFDSLEDGFEAVTRYLRRAFFDKWGLTTIEQVGELYCTGSCDAWATDVAAIYTQLGGDLGDLTFASSETLIDFEQFTGPSLFGSADPPLTIDNLVTFSGGQLLGAATNLPADRSVLYGTAHFCSGCEPTITIDFSQPVSRFSMFLYNGWTRTITYVVESDQGDLEERSLIPNLQSGFTTVFLESQGIQQVVIRGDSETQFDFLIDNVRFTAGLAPADTSQATASVDTRVRRVSPGISAARSSDPNAVGAMPR